MALRRPLAAISLTLASALVLSACGNSEDTPTEDPTNDAETSEEAEGDDDAPAEDGGTVTIEDNNGTHELTVPPNTVVATDNRTFETLSDWGVELVAGAVTLMPDTIPYTTDDSIIDLGSHGDPNLEALTPLDPDLVVNGQRYAHFHDEIQTYAPNALVLELDPRDGEDFAAELKRQISVLGDVFDKQAEAEQLIADFDEALARVEAAYDSEDTVMGVITSGGNIGYIAPGTGRTLGWVFESLGLTPALEQDGSDDHQGDDISVEAIADSNPDWILVMDRDAAVASDDAEYTPSAEMVESPDGALQNTTAVSEGNIVYMPADTYTNEGIQTFTEFLNDFADALEAKN